MQADVVKKRNKTDQAVAKRESLARQLQLVKEGLPDNAPGWVTRLWFQEMRAAMPTLTATTKAKLLTASEQGAFWGHIRALVGLCVVNKDLLPSEQERKAIEHLGEEVNGLLIRVVWRLNGKNGCVFCERFGRAWERGWLSPDTLPVGGKGDETTWEIKRTLILHWRTVEKFSLPELCEFLRKEVPRAENARGFQERVKKICQRCGFRYRAKAD
jgi:hypothetical protein